MVGYFWKLSYFRAYQDILTRLSSSAVQCAGFSLQMSHSRLSHVVTAHSALWSLESDWAQEWPTFSRCLLTLTWSPSTQTMLYPSMFYFHDITSGECADCALDQVIKVFDWIILGLDVSLWTNQRPDVELLTNERLCIITLASLWSRKLVTLHSIYELHPHMCPDSDNNQHKAHTEFDQTRLTFMTTWQHRILFPFLIATWMSNNVVEKSDDVVLWCSMCQAQCVPPGPSYRGASVAWAWLWAGCCGSRRFLHFKHSLPSHNQTFSLLLNINVLWYFLAFSESIQPWNWSLFVVSNFYLIDI